VSAFFILSLSRTVFTDEGHCHRSENVLFSFLESYISRLEGPIAVQMWNSSWSFARDVLANSTVNKNQLFPTLKYICCLSRQKPSGTFELTLLSYYRRCFTILAEKISQTSALEDRRMRRDLQVCSSHCDLGGICSKIDFYS
jgi:hypothetical protein